MYIAELMLGTILASVIDGSNNQGSDSVDEVHRFFLIKNIILHLLLACS